MFSKTPVAKEFRRWVLDLIENHNQLSENIVQLPQVQVDMKAIGGMVKRCAAVAIRDELESMYQVKAENIDLKNRLKQIQLWVNGADL